MNRLLIACVLLAFSCGTSELVSSERGGTGSAEDELHVGACFNQTGNVLDFLDGGLDRLQACLADAGIPVNLPPVPPLPGFDGGFPPIPSFDAGVPPTPPVPGFDGGFPPLPSFDAGLPPLPPLPSFDAGSVLPPGLLDPCSAGCTCPNGLTCLNPLSQTCPGTLTLCVL